MKKFTNWIKVINSSFWCRVRNSIDFQHQARSLGILRWIYGFYAFLVATPSYSWLGKVPPGFYDPPLLSIAWFFNTFPPAELFHVLDLMVPLIIFLVMVGIKARVFTILLVVVNIFGLSFTYSMGKIDHHFLELAMLLCMVIAGWGRHYALLPDKKLSFESPVKGLGILAVCICFGMLSAGLPKLIYWIDFDLSTSGFLAWYFGIYLNPDPALLLMPYVKYMPLWSFELIDYTAIFFELSATVFLLLSRKYWLLWLLAASFFHFSNTLILNISFTSHVMVYLAFINFNVLYKKVVKNNEKKLAIAGSILLIAHLVQRLFNNSAEILFITEYQTYLTANVLTGFFIWPVVILHLILELKKGKYINF